MEWIQEHVCSLSETMSLRGRQPGRVVGGCWGMGTCGKTLGDHMVGLGPIMWSRLAGSRLPKGPRYIAGPQVPWISISAFVIVIFAFYSKKQIQWYIICYIKYGGISGKCGNICARCWGQWAWCGDDDDASLEVATGMGRHGKQKSLHEFCVLWPPKTWD